MTTLGGPTNIAPPLSGEEIQLADRAARRLHEQIRNFLSTLPADSRNASGLARFLDIDRTTCQRLVFTASRPYAGLNLFDRLPGIRGLRQLADAARSTSPRVNDEALSSLETAIDRLEEAIHTLGGSQSAVIRRIAATPLASPDAPVESGQPQVARERLFEAAAEITGRFSETWVAVYVYHPGDQADGRTINVARAHGLVGHVARRDAVPLTFHNFISKRKDGEAADAADQAFRNLSDTATLGNSPDSILRDFSTNPLPVVSSRQPGEYLVQAIDTDPAAAGQAVDLMLATRNAMPHPATEPPRIEEVWAMINFPARQMVFDVYMHRDLARQCIPALDAHLWRPDFAAQIGDRWQTRFSDGPRLELLGQGIQNAATPSYGRHSELTRFLFSSLNLDDSRFVGYRCTVAYPVWRTGYCMSFDFNASDES